MNRTRVVEVFSEERAQGFSSIASVRLTWAVLTDASNGGIAPELVRSVRDVVLYLDEVMGEHPDADCEELLRARALTPGLLIVLDILLEGDRQRAWDAYTCLHLLARAGLLGSAL